MILYKCSFADPYKITLASSNKSLTLTAAYAAAHGVLKDFLSEVLIFLPFSCVFVKLLQLSCKYNYITFFLVIQYFSKNFCKYNYIYIYYMNFCGAKSQSVKNLRDELCKIHNFGAFICTLRYRDAENGIFE